MKKGRKRSAPKKDPAKRQRALKRSKSKAIELRTRRAKSKGIASTALKGEASKKHKTKSAGATKAKTPDRQQKSVARVRRKMFTKSWLEAVQMQITDLGSSAPHSSCDCEILYNGRPINGAINVLPGQLVSFSIHCKKGSPGDFTWTVPGVIFSDYSASDSAGTLTPVTNFTSDSISFYWADTGNNRVVSVQYTCDGQTMGASATVSVIGPQFTFTPTMPGRANTTIIDGKEFAILLATDTDGVVFSAEVSVPSGYGLKGGDWGFFQLGIFINDTLKIKEGGFCYSLSLAPDPPMADGLIPYPFYYIDEHGKKRMKQIQNADGNVYTTGDSPRIPIDGCSQCVAQEDYLTYLMFRPKGDKDSDTAWVPLSVINWSWKGCLALNSGGNWYVGSRTPPPSTLIGPTNTNIHPQWLDNLSNYVNPSSWSRIPCPAACPPPSSH
jgi:hypothetical protein